MTNFAPASAEKPAQKKNISGDIFKKYLMNISASVNNYDSESAMKILKELCICNLPEAFAVKVEECVQAMEDYDYDKVGAIVNNILKFI